ncbi:MAG: hypothetical protein ACYC4U_18690 [Pirellulaceae bacterium]
MKREVATKLSVLFLAFALPAGAVRALQPAGTMPLLVVTDPSCADNKFGDYLTEILRGEGLVEFEHTARNTFPSIDPALLQTYDTILLADMQVSADDESLLRGYVQNGGTLIAMRPRAALADLFGVAVQGVRPEQLWQYFAAAASLPATHGFPEGLGIVDDSLQYHGEATTYTLVGAHALAWLCDDAKTPSPNPAVTLHRYGQGSAVAFAFDLAKSIALTRQGNPEWQNTEGDGTPQYRPTDMFFRLDGRAHIDLDRMQIPQADEAQRLLANLIMTLADRPLPRMWYLPGTNKRLMVNTGDAENNSGTELEPAFDDCTAAGGHFTAYLREVGIQNTTVEQETAWREAGHEVGVHMWAGGAEGAGAEAALDSAYGTIVNMLHHKFGHGSPTARNHTIDWTGWVTMATIEAAHGTRMDLNYYHYLAAANTPDTNGYLTGSGLPQRLIDESGQLLPIYQAATQWPDEWFADKGLTVAQTVDLITAMFEAAEKNGFYSAFVNNIHQVRYNNGDHLTPHWPRVIWQYCHDSGIPSWSAEMLLAFVEARDASQFKNLDWVVNDHSGLGELEFDFSTPIGGQDLTILLPMQCGSRKLTHIFADGEPLALNVQHIKAIPYAMFTTREADLEVKARYGPSPPGDPSRQGVE